MNLFKFGDWIKSTRYPNLRPIQITSIYESNTRPGILGLKSKGTVLYSDEVELWQPIVGEWCWFWDENYTTAILAKFENISNGLFVEHHGNIFEYCEPFIGQLPTHLKDQS